jgi:hypothetical protein
VLVSALAYCTEFFEDGALIVNDKEQEANKNDNTVIDIKEYTKSVQFPPPFSSLHIYPTKAWRLYII